LETGVKLLLTIRTADRAPKPNYLWKTVESLRRHGVAGADIHVFPTDPDMGWLLTEVPYPAMTLHPPDRRMRANENGIRPITLLDAIDADWIILSEDDLEWCADPIGSMARWLETFQRPDVVMYRFFSFDRLTQVSAHAVTAPLCEQKGSQAVALRASDARRFAAWSEAHPLDWRPKGAPYQNRPHDGFDKLLGYWALQDRPSMMTGLVSRPFFVKHLGVHSSLHGRGVTKDAQFIGAGRSYAPVESSWP
jgi:hypothetical protein